MDFRVPTADEAVRQCTVMNAQMIVCVLQGVDENQLRTLIAPHDV